MRTRRFVSLALIFSFLVMSFTGIMLFIVPKGRVANWVHWRMFGLTKTQYADIHSTMMVLFVVLVIWHIVLNWKPIVNYFSKIVSGEFVLAFVIVSLFVVGTLAMVPPFSTFVNFGNSVKSHWAARYGSPPYGHAEESSLKRFCSFIRIDPQQAVDTLRKHGIKVESLSETLNEIAAKNGITPQDIYRILRRSLGGSGAGRGLKSGGGKYSGSGYRASASNVPQFLGRRTLKELSDMGNINLKATIDFLRKKGINADENSTLRDIAGKLGITPRELYEELVNESKGKHS